MPDLVAALDGYGMPADNVRGRPATVAAVPAGTLVAVRFAGDTTDKLVPYLDSYTPTVDDVVMVLQFGANQYLILGTPA